MSARIKTGMVLAAGFGTRMRPLTDTKPKPLIPLMGEPLIDWCMDRMRDHGTEKVVVNAHYLADQLQDHFHLDPMVTMVHETEILETGGGVLNALPELGNDPFFVANSDVVWLEGPSPAMKRLEDFWDDETMDALLLLQPTVRAFGYTGYGDYFLDPLGNAIRRSEGEVAPYLFTGLRIVHPRLFDGEQPGAFSMLRLFDKAEAEGRLKAVVHDGEWYHLGTPEALDEAEDIIRRGQTRSNTR